MHSINYIPRRIKKSLSELEHLFQSICETADKFTPIQQAKLKMDITNMVSTIQIKNYESELDVIVIQNSQLIFDDANQSQQ